MLITTSLRDRTSQVRAVALVGVLGATLAGALAAAASRSGWITFAALLMGLGVEITVRRRMPVVGRLLARVGAGLSARSALRMLTVLLLAARCLEPSLVVGTAVTAVVIVAIAIVGETSRAVVERLRVLPLVTRNVDLGGLGLPPLPPAFSDAAVEADAVSAAIAALGLTIAMHHNGSPAIAAVGLALATVVAAIPSTYVGLHAIALLRGDLRSRLTTAASGAIGALAPEVILYFDGQPEELYQLRMWVDPVVALGRPAAIVLRKHAVFDALGDCGLPVICTPYNGTIAALPLPAPTLALFVTHSGNNLSMIRRAGVRTVFVGHGDSDKPDSVNPFARVYDEVWVAGPLGRRRYALAGIGVDDRDIIEIGRPQVAPPHAPPPQPLTIVYAPTWEGWGDDAHHSSLAHLGVALVANLSARPDLRVRYRPHPLTGQRSAALREAHQRVIELVGRVPDDEPLSETFASASGLIGDVSSIVNEFLPYDRPYAVPDTRGLGHETFVARFPSTAGGFVLTPDFDGLDEFVTAAGGATDITRTARRELVADALGDPATAQQRFATAVDRLLG